MSETAHEETTPKHRALGDMSFPSFPSFPPKGTVPSPVCHRYFHPLLLDRTRVFAPCIFIMVPSSRSFASLLVMAFEKSLNTSKR